MAKNKVLPKPRTRYYVNEPVIVMPLAQLERLANHMQDIHWFDRKTQNQQLAIEERTGLLLKEVRKDIKAAKEYYKINATSPDA